LRKSGLPKAYADPKSVSKIQNYYHKYKAAARNWENESQPRIEIRGLKYDLMDQTDLNIMRLADGAKLPSQKAIKAIINEKRVVSLIKRIDFTSTYFINIFVGCKAQAIEVLELIDGQYDTNKEKPL
jgi:arginyl-tRNA synthetase